MQEIKYDKIGQDYNLTRKADPYLTDRLVQLLIPDPNKKYLDIGCGTGNYTIALAKKGLQLTGIDPSKKMIDEARRRYQSILWLQGFAENLPITDQTFDGVLCTLTIHHWPDLKAAFREINRILNEEGRIILFTSTPEQMKGYWLNHYFPRMLKSSVTQMPSLATIEEAIETSGLTISFTEPYIIHDDLQDHFLYSGKKRPEIYFDEQIRSGISSFATLSNEDEVKMGLERLRHDIDHNIFQQIKEQYENHAGDYLFVQLTKKQ